MFKDLQATIIIDLSKSEEDLFKQLDKDAKWGIKKAEKEKITVELTKSEEDLKRFYEIYKRTIILGRIAPDDFKELKKEDYLLFVAKKDNQVIAGAIIEVLNKEEFRLEYNASLQGFLKFQPNNLIYWALIKWGKHEGFKTFDLGGYQLKAHGHLSGINKFKERWGGQIKIYHIKSWNLFYILGRKVIRNISIVKRIKDWSKLRLYLIKDKYSRNSIKKYGFIYFINKFVKKFIYNRAHVLLYSADLINNKVLEPEVDAKIKQVSAEELIHLINDNENLQKELIEERFDNGHLCFIFLVNGALAHYSWVRFKEMEISEASITLPLDNSQAVIYDCFTFEEFRGKGIYPSMLTKIKENLKNMEFKKCYIYVESKNISSIKGIEKAGFKKDKLLKCLALLGLKFKKIEETR